MNLAHCFDLFFGIDFGVDPDMASIHRFQSTLHDVPYIYIYIYMNIYTHYYLHSKEIVGLLLIPRVGMIPLDYPEHYHTSITITITSKSEF